MTIAAQIEQDIMVTMKAREQEKLDALRMVRAALKNEQIAVGHELADEAVHKVLGRLLKQRQEAAQQYRQGGRTEAADKEDREAKLIESYLPAQLTDEEIKTMVAQAITATSARGPADFGKVMGAVMKTVAGRADGTRIAALVKEQLNINS